MRIAIMAGEYPPSQGGLGDYTRELSRELAGIGHELHVITQALADAPASEVSQGIRVHRIMPKWDWWTIRRIQPFIREWQPDVLSLQYQAAAYNMHAAINLLPGWLAPQVPVVVTFHDLKAPYLFPKAGPIRKQAILHMARSASATIVTNPEDRDSLVQAHIHNVHMIPIGSNVHPVPVTQFNRHDWLRTHSLPVDARLVGYFGFLNESKGAVTLVRALAELRTHIVPALDTKLLFIGGQVGASDPTNVQYAQQLLQLADTLHVREHVIMTGYMDEREVSAAFTACDCIALPYRDGASYRRGTLMAALEHGCAIVTTTPAVPLPEFVDESNVMLVPAEHPTELASAIARILCEEPLRNRIQRGSKELSTLFAWNHIAADTMKVFEHTPR